MDALIAVSATTGSVRKAILEALNNERFFAPCGQRHTVTLEDLDTHGRFDPSRGSVWFQGFEVIVVCPNSFMGSRCALPYGHGNNHRTEG